MVVSTVITAGWSEWHEQRISLHTSLCRLNTNTRIQGTFSPEVPKHTNINKSGGDPKNIPKQSGESGDMAAVYLRRGTGRDGWSVSRGCLDESVCGSSTRRHSGLDLQRELIQSVFIHHKRLVQQELGHLEGQKESRWYTFSSPFKVSSTAASVFLNRYPFMFVAWK